MSVVGDRCFGCSICVVEFDDAGFDLESTLRLAGLAQDVTGGSDGGVTGKWQFGLYCKDIQRPFWHFAAFVRAWVQKGGFRVVEFDGDGLFLLLSQCDACGDFADSERVAGELLVRKDVVGGVLKAAHVFGMRATSIGFVDVRVVAGFGKIRETRDVWRSHTASLRQSE